MKSLAQRIAGQFLAPVQRADKAVAAPGTLASANGRPLGTPKARKGGPRNKFLGLASSEVLTDSAKNHAARAPPRLCRSRLADPLACHCPAQRLPIGIGRSRQDLRVAHKPPCRVRGKRPAVCRAFPIVITQDLPPQVPCSRPPQRRLAGQGPNAAELLGPAEEA